MPKDDKRSRRKKTGSAPTTMGAALREAGANTFGKSKTKSADQAFNAIYGIPLTGALPLQFVTGLDILPLEAIMSVVGAPKSWKSTFSWWLVYKYLESGGFCVFIDTEDKTNWDTVYGIIPAELRDNLVIHETVIAEDMVKYIQVYSDTYLSLFPKKDVPFLFMVDSMGALIQRASLSQLDEKGSAEKGFDAAHLAAYLTTNLKALKGLYLYDRPAGLLYVNHQKVALDSAASNFKPGFGPPKKSSPGGVHKDYAYINTLELSRGKKSQTASVYKRQLIIKGDKTTYGRDGRRVSVDVIINSEAQELDVTFDWDTSLADLIIAGTDMVSAELNDVLGGVTKGSSKDKIKIGRIGSKTFMSKKELGAAIHADAQLVTDLQDVMCVKRKRHFEKPKS